MFSPQSLSSADIYLHYFYEIIASILELSMRLLGFYQYGTHNSVRTVIDSSALCYLVILVTASACIGCDHRGHGDNLTVTSMHEYINRLCKMALQ